MFEFVDVMADLDWGQVAAVVAVAFLLGAIYGRWREQHVAARVPGASGRRSSRTEVYLAMYCCGAQMASTQQIGDFRQYGVCFLKCVKCKREICMEEATKVAELDYAPVASAANPQNAEG